MEIGIIYRDLIKNPQSPSVYRSLYKYYSSKKMNNEANAFAELLRYKFNEIIIDDEKNNSTDTSE